MIRKTALRRAALSLLAAFFIYALPGCGRAAVDEKKSPVLENAEIYSKNAGTEDSQQVILNLFFDKNVKVNEKKADTMRLAIGEKRIAADKYEVNAGEKGTEAEGKVTITVPVTSVTSGQLEFGIAEKADAISLITDETGKYAAKEFFLSAIVPSGVILQGITDADGQTVPNVKQVAAPYSIRSIAWLQLLDKGQVAEPSSALESEVLDNASAVHGHEFLRDSKEDIAQNITQIINQYYGDDYEAACQDDKITLRSKSDPDDASLDLKLYTYTKINGKQAVSRAEENMPVKVKADRPLEAADKEFMNALHLAYKEKTDSPYGTGALLYKTLGITGAAVGEEQNYSVSDLEALASQSFENKATYDLGLVEERKDVPGEDGATHSWQGIDFRKFLELCRDESAENPVYAECTWENGAKKQVFRLDDIGAELGESPALIAFGEDGFPILPDTEGGSPLCLVFENGTVLKGITRIVTDASASPQDPHYTMHHLRDGYDTSNDISFTFNLYKGEELQDKKVITTKELEEMALAHPEAVRRGYYGVSGNRETFSSMGSGGWLDYFEGVDLHWLMEQELGEIDDSAVFKFFGRDQKKYAEIDDSTYIKDSEKTEAYYVLDRDGSVIPGAIPMLAYGKNGYPLLKKHDHESAQYVPYNFLNKNLEKMGIATEIGVVKNHNGPFVAGLGDRDGIYGGSQKETGGDCVRIDIICK